MPHPAVSTPRQSDFLAIPESPLVYWLPQRLLMIAATSQKVGESRRVVKGVSTSWEGKFIRFAWEAPQQADRWFAYAKGGGYRKWQGVEWYCFDWKEEGARLKIYNTELYNGSHWSKRVINTGLFGHNGLLCSRVARGSLGFRLATVEFGFDSTAIFIATQGIQDSNRLLIDLNSRIATFILRSTMPAMVLESGYVGNVPLFSGVWPAYLYQSVSTCLTLKRQLVAADPTERSFAGVPAALAPGEAIAALLHTLEGINEREVFAAYGVAGEDMRAVLDETGVPAGFHPLVAGYDALPSLPAPPERPASEDAGYVDEGRLRGLPEPAQAAFANLAEAFTPTEPTLTADHLAAHARIAPTAAELRRIKERLRALYEAGPGAKEEEPAEAGATGEDEEGEGAASGAHIPIPTETFLEELSVKMQLHPISVYWLLEELRREGARCKPEERRLLEDRLSVLVLRLLGHRWPSELRIENEELRKPGQERGNSPFSILHSQLPSWADRDGIIALTSGPDGLAERVRARLREEDGDVGANRAEGLLLELTGLSLEEWLRREFFKRHVRQFKYRPIAWHLASDPTAAAGGGGKGTRRGGKRQPAFECLLYYHATAGDALARVRTQYVEPLLRVERQNLDAARRTKDETAAAQAQARIQELEEFTRRLREVEEQGFACPELDTLVVPPSGGNAEPLDRWCGDGLLAPAERDDLLRQERAWRVDLNDGVRVNIAPIQLAGLLVSDVLKAADAKKALADRSRWRSDERRWVREGKLPRCGWMSDAVPESEAWTKLAPQREAERRKLEEKRRAAMGDGA